jgi:hypothetical protein
MDGRLDEEREGWDALVEGGEDDDSVSDIDDSEDAEVYILQQFVRIMGFVIFFGSMTSVAKSGIL